MRITARKATMRRDRRTIRKKGFRKRDPICEGKSKMEREFVSQMFRFIRAGKFDQAIELIRGNKELAKRYKTRIKTMLERKRGETMIIFGILDPQMFLGIHRVYQELLKQTNGKPYAKRHSEEIMSEDDLKVLQFFGSSGVYFNANDYRTPEELIKEISRKMGIKISAEDVPEEMWGERTLETNKGTVKIKKIDASSMVEPEWIDYETFSTDEKGVQNAIKKLSGIFGIDARSYEREISKGEFSIIEHGSKKVELRFSRTGDSVDITEIKPVVLFKVQVL